MKQTEAVRGGLQCSESMFSCPLLQKAMSSERYVCQLQVFVEMLEQYTHVPMVAVHGTFLCS